MRLTRAIFGGRLPPKQAPALVVVLALALFSIAKAQDPVAEIPYRFDYDGWITVPVTVNGEGPYDFIVDTGATLSVVFKNLDAKQNFPYIEGEPRRILGLIETNDLPPRYIGTVASGGQVMEDVVSVVIDDWLPPRPTPQGVLGLDFLSPYAVHIDPATQTIKLYDSGPPDAVDARGWSKVRLAPQSFGDSARPLYVVKARIRSKTYPFILDLGASGTIINYPALRNMLAMRRVTVRSSATASRSPQVHDLFGNEARSQLVRIQRMKIGRAIWRNKIVSVYNSKVFNELGVGDVPYGLLGADMIRDRRIVIDFQNNRLHIGPRVEKRTAPSN